MSRRAEVLKSLLPYINVGHYTEWNGFIIFGTPDVQELMDKVTGAPREDDDEAAQNLLRTFISDVVVHGGRKDLHERLSLGQAPELRVDELFMDQSPEVIQRVADLFEGMEPEIRAVAEAHRGTPDPAGEADSIEAALAEEIIGKLPKAVDRASTLDGLNLGKIPIKDLKGYFEEAHRCYLFGFNIACAVLCRAIIEAALQNVVDPKKLIKSKLKREDSYVEQMAIEAGRGGILTDDRPHCVIEVRDAGNAAIHKYPDFERIWLPKLGEIVDHTRKILLDLYPNER